MTVMSQPVKLSDNLVLDARLAGDIMERSIAGQVEFWARIGRAVEQMLDGRQALALCREGAARPLTECLASVDTPRGRRRTAQFLAGQPFPHYEAHPERAGVLIRIDADGTRTEGRFLNHRFRPVTRRK
jgi:hypothetical protein